MPFNDTTNGNGIIQSCEFWTNLGAANISGVTATLNQFTLLVNNAFENIMPLLLSYNSTLRWDDINNADLPIATFSIVSGQSDYTIQTDDNSLDILNITDVRILQPNSTEYVTLDKMSSDDHRALTAMSPNATDVGTPIAFLKRGNVLFLYPRPNYSSTGKIFFERQQRYFVSDDTTKKAGIPRHFQSILPLHASYDWLLVNRPDNQMLITRIEEKIKSKRQDLTDMIETQYPFDKAIKTHWVSSR